MQQHGAMHSAAKCWRDTHKPPTYTPPHTGWVHKPSSLQLDSQVSHSVSPLHQRPAPLRWGQCLCHHPHRSASCLRRGSRYVGVKVKESSKLPCVNEACNSFSLVSLLATLTRSLILSRALACVRSAAREITRAARALHGACCAQPKRPAGRVVWVQGRLPQRCFPATTLAADAPTNTSPTLRSAAACVS